jgi:hypothetical protein
MSIPDIALLTLASGIFFGAICGSISSLLAIIFKIENRRFMYHYLTLGILGTGLMAFRLNGFHGIYDFLLFLLIYGILSSVILSILYKRFSFKVFLSGFLVSVVLLVVMGGVMLFILRHWGT